MNSSVVIMGVSGCGKSSLGAALAQAEGLALVEGDDFHSEANRAKMASGVALTDADRAGWLSTLAGMLASRPGALVLTCSALKRSYRAQLRAASPGLGFVFLEIEPAQALARVQARQVRQAHFFSASLVANQFATLEPPDDEPRVLRLNALAPLAELRAQASAWLRQQAAQPSSSPIQEHRA